MKRVLDLYVPGLLQAAELRESIIGDGLGLFATRSFEAKEVIHSWCLDASDDGVLRAPKALIDKFEAGAYAALAFEVLKAARSQEPGPWRDWFNAGASSPKGHPVKLISSNPGKAQELWMSTTCGSSMSSMALDVKDDLDTLQGQSDLEEWTGIMSLVMSRSLANDPAGNPMLVMGLDFLQDGDEPNVFAEIRYRTEGGGFLGLGLGPDANQVPCEIALVADRYIMPGEELCTRYLESRRDFAGKYLELFGFVPRHMLKSLGETSVELQFAPTDEDEDWNFNVKEQMLEDIGMTTDPIPFVVGSGDPVAPNEEDEDFPKKTVTAQIAHILRLKNIGGPDSYLIEPIYINDVWNFCSYRISKANELAVCEDILKECNRWLELFESLEGTDEDEEDEISKAAAFVRKREAQLLSRIKISIVQEMRETAQNDNRLYWVDRKMLDLFPGRKFLNQEKASGNAPPA